MTKKTKIAIISIVAFVLYISALGLVSVLSMVSNRSYCRTQKVLITDGSRLFVSDIQTSKTSEQVFADRPVFVDGVSADTWLKDNKVYVRYGDKTDVHSCNKADYPVWSPVNEACYFLDAEQKGQTKMRIWKWSKPTGFVPITNAEDGLCLLTVSLDGKNLAACQYLAHLKKENMLYVCSTEGQNIRHYRYGRFNFRPVMLGKDDFLVNEYSYSLTPELQTDSLTTYRWSPKTGSKKVFSVGRPVSSSIAMGNSVWVLFQESQYSFLPWVIQREENKVMVSKLSDDLKRIENEALLGGK